VVFDRLDELGVSISFAESCTGGMIGAALTDIPGSSRVFKGAVTAYSNEAKINILGVSSDVIEKYGAVSRETAEAMAVACRKLFGTDYSVAVTGVAGPGDSELKPAGLVYLCLVSSEGTIMRKLDISKDRSRVRKLTVLNAFDMIRRELETK
jgi:nicotinamide-nucleotide amidase